MNTNKEYILKEECYQVIGCCMAVHNELGCGFLEPVYQEALGYELLDANIPFEKEQMLHVKYKDRILNKKYFADFFCYGQLIVELKAVEKLSSSHTAQVLNYFKATQVKLGILVNFGAKSLEYKRIIY